VGGKAEEILKFILLINGKANEILAFWLTAKLSFWCVKQCIYL
jgi:hypothetical protein